MPPRKPKLRLVPAPTAPSVPTPKHDPYPHERAEIEALEPEHFKALVSISTMIQGLDLRYHRLPRQETEHYKALLDLGLIRADTQAYALSYIAPARVAMATLAIAFARDPKSVPMATLSPVSRLRAAVAGGDVRELGMLASSGDSILSVIGPAARPEWLAGMSAELRVSYLSAALRRESMELGPIAHLLEAAAQQREPMKALPELRLRTAIGLALRGEWVAALTVANGRLAKWGREAIELLVAYWSGEFAEALELGTRTIQAMTTARKDPSLADIAGICHILVAIVGAKQPEQLAEVDRLIEVTNLGGRPSVRESLMAIRWRLLGGADLRSRPVVAKWHRDSGDWLKVYVDLLHDAWLPQNDRKGPRPLVLATAELWRARAEAGGYPAIASEFAAIGDHVGPRESSGGLVSLFHPPTAWEAALASLEVAALQNTETAAAPRELLWQIDGDPPRWITIKARVRSGRATKGRSVPFDRLLDSEFADLLTDADRRVLASVTTSGYYRGVGPILALVGHPRVIDKHGASVQVERGRPTLRTIQANGSTTLELVPAELVDHDIVVSEPGPGRMVVYEQTREILQIVEALVRPGGFVVPDEGRGRLAQVLARLAALGAVEVEGDLAVTAETVESDSRPVFQLGWNGGALAVRLRVVPLGAGGPTLMPGVGAERLVADVRRDGRTELRQCSRVLEQERGLATAALDACPTLSGFADGEWQWRASSIHVALEILLELDALGEAVVVAWQAGQKLDLPRVADLSDLRIKVKSGKAWFEVDANLQIDEFTVMQFRELLRNREGSRFVALPRGQFLALSDRLRQHLDKIESLGVPSGDGLRAAPAVLPMLEDLAAETIDADFDPAALARLSKLRKISERVPKLPRGFAAKLRDYQREGYEFLMRLAEAGFGACLADDMGLGKTIQALAVLTARSKSGPSLVVCPTSVVTNWINEAERFAPTLRFATLGDAPDRAALVAAAGPRDVIVTTYSLLANEIELLAKIEFSTAVFDEAHALKNAKTQRATAARSIVAEFRLALTGTPIENHLGELWSLFAVIVPGLLGNESNFEERFTNLRDDRERSLRLRALLRPFVLRRLKSQVLDELPPRTEITLRIEPNPEQRGWYEAMRREALARIQSMKQAKQRFQLLAEITKLRQAAIDPRLVDPEAPKGEKFGVLLDRIDELRAEGHRALVFTQFLASMAEIRNGLEERGIESFQIDGSTPARERARRIDAFQAGEADVFVLSLRAGGVGINLTGADYVFHIDPWWNPAVEDQASDRAHRIGQRRPVTIYRLVTAGTIEEKILELHANKRQLADDLLNGLETGEVLDLEQLRGLLGG